MKKTLVILLFLEFICSCNNQVDNFNNHQVNNFDGNQWELLRVDKRKFLDGGEIVYSLQTVFRNDSSFGLLTEMMGSPIRHLNDSMIGLHSRDTFLYDFKYILNTPVLLIKSIKYGDISILINKDLEAEIVETHNFYHLTEFTVGEYKIGDTVDISNLINIEEVKYEEYDFEATPNNNESIKLKVLNNFVYEIEQGLISDDKVSNILDVVSKKIGNYDTLNKEGFNSFYEEGFEWRENDVNIRLSKKDMVQYYLDRLLEIDLSDQFSYLRIGIYEDYIDAVKLTNELWTLDYNHEVLQQIIRGHNTTSSESTIIK